MQKYEIIKELGSGSYGKVYLAKIKKSGEQVALKEIEMSLLDEQAKSKAFEEVQLLSSLQHPNIVAHRESFQDNGKFYIAMEYVDGGDLSDKISNRKTPFTEDEVLKIFIQICFALKYIHEKKVVHRDIKPQNVFLTHLGIVKLGDFGVARALEGTQDMCKTVIGTPYYLSPEVWSNQPYSTKTDIWSLGCILYELCTLNRPFNGRSPQQLFAAIIRGHYNKVSTKYSAAIRKLIDSMLNPDANARPTAADILQLPFIQAKSKKMVEENQDQLKNVNIIARKDKSPKRHQSPQRKKTVNLKPVPETPDNDPLPLPDEEPPRWAQRGPALQKSDPIIVEEEDQPEPNEWDDLKTFTEQLRDSISNSTTYVADASLPHDKQSAQAEIDSIMASLSSIQPMLISMLEDNIINEDQESCQEFIEIFAQSDPQTVEKMRRVVKIKKMFDL